MAPPTRHLDDVLMIPLLPQRTHQSSIPPQSLRNAGEQVEVQHCAWLRMRAAIGSEANCAILPGYL